MKKILSLVVLLAVIGHVRANAFDSKSPVGMSVLNKGKVVQLFYRGEEAGEVKVAIYNEKGVVVFRETMKNTEHFMRPYNFSRLPAGDYTIELTNKKGSKFQKFSYGVSKGKRIAHLSRLRGPENKYVLYVPNAGRDKLTVRIYDAADRVLYRETQSIEGNFAKVYNLSQIEGEHIFEIVDKKGNSNRLAKTLD